MDDRKGLRTNPINATVFRSTKKNQCISLFVVKMVHDFLMGGTTEELHIFHEEISARFRVGCFACIRLFIFNGLHINQDDIGNIQISMQEYMDKIMKTRK